MRIAAVAHAPGRSPDWDTLEARLDRIVAGAGADLVVLPEYAGVEAALIDAPATLSPVEWRDRTAAVALAWAGLVGTLARRHGCHILAGTTLWPTPEGIVNRAFLFAPSGAAVHQDKLILTPYERDVLHLTAGRELRLFETALGRIGVLVCYDSEFPLLARALVEGGASIILVPSCTDLPAGQTRVRQSCRARAIEGQCLIVQAPLVGGVAGCDIVDVNCGRAALFAPPDHGLPPDGIIAQSIPDQPAVVVAQVDPAAIARPRAEGQVGNFRHWPEQEAHRTVAQLQRLR
ncbi:MAG: carbon-nitrogen hydrolase family protein [Rubellimicrobium sp.]|nr:carbon-nitrogen hydrolase family protein [Rubellimicrobium sp.]